MSVPTGWNCKPIGSLTADIGDGGTPNTNHRENFGGSVCWVVIQDIQKQITTTTTTLTERGLKSCSAKLWPVGTLILSTGATIGEVGIAGVPLATKQGIHGIVCNKELSSEFLYYKLCTLKDFLKANAQGSTIREVRAPFIRTIRVAYPEERFEQSKIAEVLSTVDRAIAQTAAMIAKQQRIKTGLMQDLLTRGIDEHGELRSEATHAFKDSPIGRIPAEWECASIVNSMDQVMDFRGRTPKKLGMDWGGEIAALSAMNVEMGKINFQKHTNYGDDSLYRRWMTHGDTREGDVIMTTEAPLGNVAQIPNNALYILSQRVILLRGKAGVLDNTFMGHYLSSLLFRSTMHKQSSGTTATGIQRRKFEQLAIPLPSLDEQVKISAAIYASDGEIETLFSQLEKFVLLKTALMQDLLTGKVRVTPLLQHAEAVTA